MNRFIKIAIFLGMVFGSTATYALDFLGSASVNIGINGVGAELSAKGEENEGLVDGPEKHTRSESMYGLYGEAFLELDFGMLALGIARAQDLESETTEHKKDNAQGGSQTTNTVQVDIDGLTTYYIKADLPQDIKGGNLYIRAGIVEADLNTNENLATGSAYDNATLEGYMAGIGWERELSELFIRIEGNKSAYDPISLTSTTNSENTVKLNSLDGNSIQFSVGKSF